MTDFEKYPALNKILTEASISPPKDGWVFAKLKKYKVVNGQQVYRGLKYGLLYVWDHTHGHWEVYTDVGCPLYARLNEDSTGDNIIEYKKGANRQWLKL